ncbi:MAG: single-stranded-DNA-specific exonuclease RecJ [Gammaproteobacteria bacterium]|nr:single-stranded-DNA-specific exonuclease RecJ [Gammaproteobacteria bacterium]
MVTDTQIITRTPLVDDKTILPESMHPILKRIYLARGVSEAKQTETTLNHLLPYTQLQNIDHAVTILAAALERQQRLLIIGDYDADGATSCALAVKALRAMGARHVEYLVPNRFEYGYGLTPEIVEVAKRKQPDVIITVDNGIASIDGVNAANAAGIRVIITDHHLPAATLPAAEAIVNPNQAGDPFASKHLAGVGVIFYVMVALRAQLRERGWFTQLGIAEPNMAEFLDLVALGTVADVVKLDHNNRIMVAQGLARMRAGQACPGILALLQVAGRDYKKVTSQDLGFCVGPRLNAAGRLDDMALGIECLLSTDMGSALQKAQVLDNLNRERRHIEQAMREQAEGQLTALLADAEDAALPAALCLYDPEFHEGVIGILAGRIKDQLHRPTIVFAASGDDLIKGSARSIPGLHIRDALDRVATRHPGLLSKFGGHAMAAGLTLRRADFATFNAVFVQTANELLDDDALQRVIHCDGQLSAIDLNLQLAETLRNAGPWGQGFAEPQFEGRFELVQRRIVGEHHLKMVLRSGNALVDAIAFRTTDRDWPAQVTQVHVVYRLDVNEFNGQRNAQLLVEYLQPLLA